MYATTTVRFLDDRAAYDWWGYGWEPTPSAMDVYAYHAYHQLQAEPLPSPPTPNPVAKTTGTILVVLVLAFVAGLIGAS